jgi:hypothetical protein
MPRFTVLSSVLNEHASSPLSIFKQRPLLLLLPLLLHL